MSIHVLHHVNWEAGQLRTSELEHDKTMDDPGISDNGLDAHGKPRIVFNLGPESKDPNVLDEEREKHRRRCVRLRTLRACASITC